MPIWRLQTQVWFDSTLPQDAQIITPHFDDHGALTDPDGLCEDLATAITNYVTIGGVKQVRVQAYDAQGTPPVFPQGDAIQNVGAAPASNGVREVAVCLSYYAEQNRPRQRGRLFIPANWLQTSTLVPTTSARPTSAVRNRVAELVPILAGLGGLDVDWVVYSRVTDTARKVTNWWVDDAWDIQRRRGLRPTTRTEGTTSG